LKVRGVPALAVLVTGVALYLSRGVLDQVPSPDGLMRVALLPPWAALAAFVALPAIGLLWLDRRAAPRGAATAPPVALGPFVLPLLGLVLLVLPYLPFLPDAVPVLQLLAGPLRAVVWLTVVLQFAWVLAQSRLLGAGGLARWPLQRTAAAIALATIAVTGTAAARLTGTVLFPTGDEPHYLVMAQSLWRDGDLKIENNHARLDYKEYFAAELAPDYLTRGVDNEIYSIHPIGMPVLIAPVYAAGGYPAVVAAYLLMAAAAAAIAWLAAAQLAGAAAASFGWAAVTLTTPFLFNSFAIYPEIPAALALVVGYTVLLGAAHATWRRWLIVGLAAGALPWLSTKYAPMSAALVAAALARAVWVEPTRDRSLGALTAALRRRSTVAAAGAVLAPYLLSLAGWFSYFYAVWGTPWPHAPYGGLVQTQLKNLVFGAPGLLADQEYGLLPYAPVYALTATGLWRMWRNGGEQARRAVEIVLMFAALLATVGAFRIWWGGTASPGRPLASALLLFAMPMAIAFRAAPPASSRRAAHLVLLGLSVGIAGLMLFAQRGLLIANGRDGTSALLEYLSPRWPAWSAAPSFIYHEAPTALAATAVWIALAAAAAFVLGRLRPASAGVASLLALTVCAVAALAGATIVARLPVTPAWPAVDVRARSRAMLLDEYDAVARPVGLEYAPLRVVSAASIPPHVPIDVLPGTRAEPQPLRVLHNGRVSLPAGRYRLEIAWNGTRTGESVGLQVGRVGDPWRTWSVEPRPGEQWSTDIDLPVDAAFVGLRGTPELERVIARIRFVPIAVSDETRRPRVLPVIGATAVDGGDFFFADENVMPEKTGFWVRGGRRTIVTVHRASAAGPLKLRLNSGLIRNRLRVALDGWSKAVVLEPKLPGEIEIPADGRALVTLELAAEFEFVPRTIDPASNDPRPLGVWVELMPS
jgi:hypothetical protein